MSPSKMSECMECDPSTSINRSNSIDQPSIDPSNSIDQSHSINPSESIHQSNINPSESINQSNSIDPSIHAPVAQRLRTLPLPRSGPGWPLPSAECSTTARRSLSSTLSVRVVAAWPSPTTWPCARTWSRRTSSSTCGRRDAASPAADVPSHAPTAGGAPLRALVAPRSVACTRPTWPTGAPTSRTEW